MELPLWKLHMYIYCRIISETLLPGTQHRTSQGSVTPRDTTNPVFYPARSSQSSNMLWHRLSFFRHFLCILPVLVTIFISVNGQGDDLANEITRNTPGSCATAGICCPGRDSSCVVQKANPNAIIEDLDDIPCYCDHACLNIGDCCGDFKSACGVRDCEISSWGSWSICDKDCGLGSMTRTRDVLVEPQNGGKPCPSLVQRRGCRGTRCQKIQSRVLVEGVDREEEHLETRVVIRRGQDVAIILPVEFSAKRKLNESSDITRNLRLRYPKNPAKEKSKPYCVEFEVIRSTRACKQLERFMTLREGLYPYDDD
ncbi:unnamed protein product [Allacma fusca]|uniref:SMB domain-containing protein n=1 Tax=Allacma fusca TaxID=39272 RepID=A0A8J2PHB9_9HEXA|nr:unnamed protein product [Allacma fusca]